MISKEAIEQARKEYLSLPDSEWRKDYFDEATGGFVATHVLKTKDDMRIPGIAAEVNACFELAHLGKQILRLPENIQSLIDSVVINGKPYRELLKFKPRSERPRGYPDAYFDGQTWDFKTSSFGNEDSLRQTIKEGRKADNIVFLTSMDIQTKIIEKVINRENGIRKADGSWIEQPNVYSIHNKRLIKIWNKR